MNKLLVYVLFFLFFPCNAKNKLIYLVSGPRSLSTVFLRIMESRGDFTIYHEPSQWANNKINYYELTKDWYRDDAPQTFDQVKEQLFCALQKSHVFTKEISFAVHNFLVNDSNFTAHPDIHFVFLVRSPHHIAISFYNRLPIIPDSINDLIGLRMLHDIFMQVKNTNPNGATIIFTEQLYNNPEQTIAAFCKQMGIPHLEHALSWEAHPDTFTGHKEWHEIKHPELIHHWHGKAITSSKVEKPTTYHVDENEQPTFIEIENVEHRSALQKAYEENLIYYDKFLAMTENHLICAE